ncbi:hypothetical protein VTN77DRAFT_9240 [Rasamsonia byssochlamydoides]|uniref:uncharacterized protein n=1 Tax=Rasamsonia byssochlamydoides TaxID=89139 RepID=UPI0037430655
MAARQPVSPPVSTSWQQRPGVKDAETPLTQAISCDPGLRVIPGDHGPPKKRARKERTLVCSWPECRRAFGKFEHLQRHERSHAGDVRYECPTCRKRFVRRDVMTRHAALHGLSAAAVKIPRKISCTSCATMKVRCDGQPGSTCSRCLASGHACQYRNRERTSICHPAPNHADNVSIYSSQTDSAVSNGQMPTENATLHPTLNIASPSMNATYQILNDVHADGSPAPVTADDDFSNLPLDTLYDVIMDSSESYFGWNITEEEMDNMKTLNTNAPNTPPANWLPANAYDSALQTRAKEQDTAEVLSALPPSSHLIRDAQPTDTPWPHVYRPSKDDSWLDLPPVSQKSRPTLHEAHCDHVTESTREAMLSLVGMSHQSHWPIVDVAAFPSTQTLTVCINLYFRHFHETLPILRRSTFRMAEANPVLLLAMAAIGAMYSRNGLDGLAVALNELARRAIAYMRESDRRAMFDTSIVQAWLLQSTFGLFCGSRMLYQHAEISRGGLVTTARRMHLLRPSLTFVKELERRRDTTTPEELRRAYADDEERRRLGWGIYLYDMQISCLLGISPLFSVGEINVPLPSDEETWNAPAAAIDFESELFQPQKSNFRTVLNSLLSAGKLPQPLNPFGFSLIAHTLYRLCTDASAFDPILSQPVATDSFPYRLAFPSNFKHNPQELLDQLSASCYSLSCMPNSLIVSVSALSHLGHIQFTWSGFLDNIKIAAGKSGTEESKRDARAWLSARISEDPVSARSILVHAGQLSALLTRFPFDTPSETVWIFDVALTFWAIIKFGQGGLLGGSSTGQNRTTITWSEFDDVEGWIQNGGPVSFQGLGDLAELTVSKILSTFSERLENMSWGIAQRFRHVLMNLSKE